MAGTEKCWPRCGANAAGNDKLVKRLGEATVQLADLQRERADWEKSQWDVMKERRQWEEKFEALERQAKESEDRFAEQARQIAELERLVEEARTNAVPMEPDTRCRSGAIGIRSRRANRRATGSAS